MYSNLRFIGRISLFVLCSYLFFLQDVCAQEPRKLGKVTSAAITEISGIVPYSYAKGHFWVHNDSGDGAFIYLIDSTASLQAKVEINGIKAIDVEDIAKFEIAGENYLLIADMGDNLRKRDTLSLYVIKEPKLASNSPDQTLKVNVVQHIKFKYADKKRDAEALFVDPLYNKVYIISKRDFESTVFSFPLDLSKNAVHTLSPLLAMPFTFATSADISKDGRHIVIKNLTNVYLWERKTDESILQTLKKLPIKIPYIIEPQGEAICFDLESRYLYTISERPFGLDSYLYMYHF